MSRNASKVGSKQFNYIRNAENEIGLRNMLKNRYKFLDDNVGSGADALGNCVGTGAKEENDK